MSAACMYVYMSVCMCVCMYVRMYIYYVCMYFMFHTYCSLTPPTPRPFLKIKERGEGFHGFNVMTYRSESFEQCSMPSHIAE